MVARGCGEKGWVIWGGRSEESRGCKHRAALVTPHNWGIELGGVHEALMGPGGFGAGGENCVTPRREDKLSLTKRMAIPKPTATARPAEYGIVVYSGPDKSTVLVQRVRHSSEIQIVARGDQFTSVRLSDGRRGFVETQFLKLPTKVMELRQDRVAMRTSASEKSDIKDTVLKGQLIECVGDVVKADGVEWQPVKSLRGESGYIPGNSRLSEPSRFYYMRQISRVHFINVWAGAVEFLLGMGLTLGTFFLAVNGLTDGWFVFFYGLIFVGAVHFLLAVRRLRIEMDIQRRIFRDRFNIS
jgi:hypothetical protein